jgi:hypothetical protein
MASKRLRFSTIARQAQTYLSRDQWTLPEHRISAVNKYTCTCLRAALDDLLPFPVTEQHVNIVNNTLAGFAEYPQSCPWWPRNFDSAPEGGAIESQYERFLWLCLLEQAGKDTWLTFHNDESTEHTIYILRHETQNDSIINIG